MSPAARFALPGYIALVGAATALGWWLALAILGGSLLALGAVLGFAAMTMRAPQLTPEAVERALRQYAVQANREGPLAATVAEPPPPPPPTDLGADRG